MMKILTITGESLEDFFNKKIPHYMADLLLKSLEVLARNGRECIGAFVYPQDDIYYFRLQDDRIPNKADIYITFIDIQELIIILDVIMV